MHDSPTAPIFLIGYRGTGKTTVAQLLAARLNRDWIDSDRELERQTGESIARLFVERGEPAFRELEAAFVNDLCQQVGVVVALGGGAVLRDQSRAAIRAAGPVVWLTASVTTMAGRLAADAATPGQRPNLTSAGTLPEIAAVLAERTPIYRACATLVIDTEEKSPADVADEIVTKLASSNPVR
jgi:shikimate kinase